MEPASERLQYRKFTAADFGHYLGLATDESVMRYITGKALTDAEAQTRFNSYLRVNAGPAEAGFFSVSTKADQAFIGLAKFVYTTPEEAEIGYSLLPAFWGRQYASELVRGLLIYASALPHLTRLIALVDPANAVSVQLLTKNHFTRFDEVEGTHLTTHYYQLERPFRP